MLQLVLGLAQSRMANPSLTPLQLQMARHFKPMKVLDTLAAGYYSGFYPFVGPQVKKRALRSPLADEPYQCRFFLNNQS